MKSAVAEEKYDSQPAVRQAKFFEGGLSERFEVEWDDGAKVTAMGSVPYFAQCLAVGGRFDALCGDAPLRSSSNNAPKARDILGTLLLSILGGHTRYAHINSLRNDGVGPRALGMGKVVSEDSARRALLRAPGDELDAWLSAHELATFAPLLAEPYVLDIDSTVKPVYGRQEGAENGCNPRKPGRPSHNIHTCFIGALRLILRADVQPGKAHAGRHGAPPLWSLADSLPAARRPRLLRGDVSHGSEAIMGEAETRGQHYLFKLARHGAVKTQFRRLCADGTAWADAGQGWQACEAELRFAGWSVPRRCVFIRRPRREADATPAAPRQKTGSRQPGFDFIRPPDASPRWDYACLATSDGTLPLPAVAQLYRDRADCENVFDEIKNQWGWSGFMTRDLKRCRVMARLVALIHNWWSIFTRLARPDRHMEAVTSRPLLLQAVGRLVQSGRRRLLRLTSNHAMAARARDTLERVRRFLNALRPTAEQLGAQRVWAVILSAAFVKWLKGSILHPCPDDATTCQPLAENGSNCRF